MCMCNTMQHRENSLSDSSLGRLTAAGTCVWGSRASHRAWEGPAWLVSGQGLPLGCCSLHAVLLSHSAARGGRRVSGPEAGGRTRGTGR